MTTPHRTLQMALDALDAITDDVDGTGLNTMPSFDKAIDAIAALREALAQPEPEPVAIADGTFNCSAPLGTLLYAAPPAAPIDGFGGNLDEAFKPAPAVPSPNKPTVQRLMDLARKFRATPGDLYDGAYKELQSACYEALSAAPAVPAVCDGGTCGLGGYCTNCPRLSAAPAVREPQDERIRWRDAVIKEAESALRTAEQEFADMPTWANMGHAAKKVTHALAVIAVLGIGGGGK